MAKSARRTADTSGGSGRWSVKRKAARRHARRQYLRRERPRIGYATKPRLIVNPIRLPDRTYCPPSVGSPGASNHRVGFGSRTCNLPRLTSLLTRLTPNLRTATTLPAPARHVATR